MVVGLTFFVCLTAKANALKASCHPIICRIGKVQNRKQSFGSSGEHRTLFLRRSCVLRRPSHISQSDDYVKWMTTLMACAKGLHMNIHLAYVLYESHAVPTRFTSSHLYKGFLLSSSHVRASATDEWYSLVGRKHSYISILGAIPTHKLKCLRNGKWKRALICWFVRFVTETW